MMHTMCDNAAKYLVCRFVRFRKHSVNSDTFVWALLYYRERWDFQDFEKKMRIGIIETFFVQKSFVCHERMILVNFWVVLTIFRQFLNLF